jgi:predicted nucleic acid-binding protein
MAAYLFDTDAILLALSSGARSKYARWLAAIPREDQFAAAASIAELFGAADRSGHRQAHLRNVELRVLPAVTILPFDVAIAREAGALLTVLDRARRQLSGAEVQIAATAVYHGLELVTGSGQRFRRVPGLTVRAVGT